MNDVYQLLLRKNLTISTCESFTTGAFCSRLLEIPNASKVVKGGIICYSTDSKIEIVNVKKDIIKKYGTISANCAKEMAIQTKIQFQSDIAISFTGNSGPHPVENKPVGSVYMCLFKKDIMLYHLYLKGTRNEIRDSAIEFMKKELLKHI